MPHTARMTILSFSVNYPRVNGVLLYIENGKNACDAVTHVLAKIYPKKFTIIEIFVPATSMYKMMIHWLLEILV